MNWIESYNSKLTTADRAVEAISPGDSVWIHAGCATPDALIEAMIRRAPALRNVEIVQMLTLGNAGYALPEFAQSFRANALFMGGNVREAVHGGRADYTPIFLHEIEELIRSGAKPLDIALIQVTPPDKHGLMSLGTGVDCTLTAAREAKFTIAQINAQMPRTMGNTFLHVNEVAALVEDTRDLPQLHPEPADSVQRRIGENVATLIPDGATLQTGIGAIPDAVLSCLTEHRNLGMHTEMFSDGVIALIESGVMNGRANSLRPGKLTAGFVLGTRRLFDFIDDNPIFDFQPIRYVNDPFVIAQNDRMIAINSAIQIDLTGQVCADSMGTRPYSGFGGQVDFIRGAARSKGGRPIIALPSTAKAGTISRIVPVLEPGAGVVTSRADVHYVVTEHGIAHLHGKTLRERAEALIRIAAPGFRDSLYDFAVKAHYLEPQAATVG